MTNCALHTRGQHFGYRVMATMSTGAAGVSAPDSGTLVGAVTGNAVFGWRMPAGNARAWENALRPAGAFGLSGGGDDLFPPDASEQVNHRLLVPAWA